MRQGTVIRAHDQLTTTRAGNNRFALRADTRINDRHKHRTLWPVWHRLQQTIGSFKRIIGRNLMRQIVHTQRRIHRQRHTCHCRNRTIHKTEITLQNQNSICFHKSPPPFQNTRGSLPFPSGNTKHHTLHDIQKTGTLLCAPAPPSVFFNAYLRFVILPTFLITIEMVPSSLLRNSIRSVF